MRKLLNMKRMLILLAVLLLTFSAATGVLAQDDGDDGDHAETEEVHEEEGDHAEEGDHGEESSGGIEALGINTGFLIAQIVNFGIILLILGAILWRPITNMLDSRATKIAKGLEDAAAAANARRNAETEAEKILAQARSEAQKVIEESRGQGDEVAKTIEAEARADADKIRDDARTGIEAERNQELAGLRDQVKAISVAIAERLIGSSMSDKKQNELISDFFTNLPDGAKNVSGAVTVVSAMPLADAEQNKVKKELGTDDITFAVDPNILGGLVVRTGDRVIDGSVRGGLNELGSQLG